MLTLLNCFDMCTCPLQIHDPSASRRKFSRESSFLVGCGKCPECLKDRQNSWKLRLVQECSQWSHVYFFTLTYSEESVPRNEFKRTSASVRDLQLWLKRYRINFRRMYGSDAVFKYFICAEYGPEGEYFYKGKMRKSTMRPHYHGILFTHLPESLIMPLFREWQDEKGFYKVDEICKSTGRIREERSSVANYVSKYCCKGEFASRAKEIEDGSIEKAFTICSKGIGSSYIGLFRNHHLCGVRSLHLKQPQSVVDSIISRRFVLDGSFRYKMPRYYADRIYKVQVEEVKEVLNFMKNVREIQKCKRFSSDVALSAQITSTLSDRVRERDNAELRYIEICRSQGVDPRIAEIKNEDISLREARLSSKLQKFYKDCASRNLSLLFTNI